MGTRHRSSQMRNRSQRQAGRVIRNVLGFLGLMALCFGLGFFVLSRLMPDTGKPAVSTNSEPTSASLPADSPTEPSRQISHPHASQLIVPHAATGETAQMQAPPAVPPPTLEPTEEEKTQLPASIDAPKPSLDPPATAGNPSDTSVQSPSASLDTSDSPPVTHSQNRRHRRRTRHTESTPTVPPPDTKASTPSDSNVQQPAPLEPAPGGNDKEGNGGAGNGNPP